jgi:hypothetical protein
MSVYTLTFLGGDRPPHERIREEDLRLATAARTIALIAAHEAPTLIVLPAGFVQARSVSQCDRWAEELASLSREHGVALAFGIDVADDGAKESLERPRSFAFACDRGRRLLWAAPALAGRDSPLAAPVTLTLGPHRCVLLVDSEVFRGVARALVGESRPELVVILAHGDATPRWVPSLSALDELAPTLIARNQLPRRKVAWRDGPRGWRAETLAADTVLTVQRWSPSDNGAFAPSMGN